jgi:hypothetical protein
MRGYASALGAYPSIDEEFFSRWGSHMLKRTTHPVTTTAPCRAGGAVYPRQHPGLRLFPQNSAFRLSFTLLAISRQEPVT